MKENELNEKEIEIYTSKEIKTFVEEEKGITIEDLKDLKEQISLKSDKDIKGVRDKISEVSLEIKSYKDLINCLIINEYEIRKAKGSYVEKYTKEKGNKYLDTIMKNSQFHS